jgi:capsular exopolysaccharide synthesis family protein
MTEAGQKPVMVEPRAMALKPAMAARGTASGITPREIIAILRRHWLMIVLLTILGLGCGGASWYLFLKYGPKYTARTFIKVLPPIEKDPTTIQSSPVAQDIQYGNRLSLAMRLTSQGMFQQLIDRDKIQQTKWFKEFGDIRDVRIRKAVKNLEKYLVANPQRDGDSIIVSMTCGDKGESALIVNEMVSLFVNSQGGTKRKEVAEKLAKLDEQQVRVQRDLDQAERTLDDIRRRYGFTDLEEHTFQSIIEQRLNDLDNQGNTLALDISQTRASIESLAAQAQGPVQVQVERQVEMDSVMLSLAQQLAFQESSLAGSLARFGEDHRIVRQLKNYIDAIQQERFRRKAIIAEQTRQANLKNAQDELATLEGKLKQYESMREAAAKQKEEMDLARVQFSRGVKIRDERRTMLDSIKGQAEKLKIMYDDPETPKVQLTDFAPEPLEASFPKWQIFFPGGTFLGLLLGIGLAFLIELLNDLVRTPKDVATYLHIPLLGMIPDTDEDEQIEDIEPAFVARQAPNSILSESYRRVRTNLKLSESGGKARTILITSGGAKDGKTTLAVNFATTLVAEGRKILLIDANFRRPNLHAIFASEQGGAQVGAGLSNLLAGQCDLQQTIRPSGMEGLTIIESGPMPANPAETLGSEAMQRLIGQLRNSYDYVIIDGPPVLLASEAKILAKYVDGTILVFNAAATRRGTGVRTLGELKQVNADILGCVLLRVRILKGGYFQETFRLYREYQALEPAKA